MQDRSFFERGNAGSGASALENRISSVAQAAKTGFFRLLRVQQPRFSSEGGGFCHKNGPDSYVERGFRAAEIHAKERKQVLYSSAMHVFGAWKQ